MFRQTARSLFLRVAFLLALAPLLVAADSSTDPATDPGNPLHYVPSNGLTTMAVIILLAVGLIQSYLIRKKGGKYMLAMTIAIYTYAVGFGLRWLLRSNLDSVTYYATYSFFITLSPCGFIAAEYVLLGRLARWLRADRHVAIPANRITLVFVMSDVTTFLTQAAGGGISASAGSDVNKANLGSKIFLVGLILQLVSFIFFTLVFIRFISRVKKYESVIWACDRHQSWFNDWRALAFAMFISQIGVIIRSVYRCVELSQGYSGHLTSTEIYLFVLDLAPLLVAICVYIPFWPGRFIPDGVHMRSDFESVPLGSTGSAGVIRADNPHAFILSKE